MIFNGNKFGKKGGDDGSGNNSISPSRRPTDVGAGTKTPKKSMNDAMSMNSSGKFSMKHVLGGVGTMNESRGEPLEMMTCPSHDGSPLDHYSINIREFMCKQCIREIEGTQREIDLNPIPVEDALKILENRLNMQNLVNLDEKIRGLLDIVRKKKDFSVKDKEESLKQVNKQFEAVYRRLEERKNTLFQAIIAISDQEVQKIDQLTESMQALKDRSSVMFSPIQSTTAIGYARSIERVLDFLSDMKDVQLPSKLGSGGELPKVVVSVNEELIKQIDNLGQITNSQQSDFLMSKMAKSFASSIKP